MTNEEALVKAEETCDLCRRLTLDECNNCWRTIAKNALNKQIPKKPYKDEYGCYRCKCCSYAVEYEAKAKGGLIGVCRDNICSNCGQAIDWGEEE